MLTITIIVIVLAFLAAIYYKSYDKKENTYKIGFGIRDHMMMGGGSYTMTYSMDLDDIVTVFIKHLQIVLPNNEAVLILENDISDYSLLGTKVSKYWVRLSIEKVNDGYDSGISESEDQKNGLEKGLENGVENVEKEEEEEEKEKIEEIEEIEEIEKEEKEKEKDSNYYLIYYSNEEKDYNILVREAIANAFEELENMGHYHHDPYSDKNQDPDQDQDQDYVSDDDD